MGARRLSGPTPALGIGLRVTLLPFLGPLKPAQVQAALAYAANDTAGIQHFSAVVLADALSRLSELTGVSAPPLRMSLDNTQAPRMAPLGTSPSPSLPASPSSSRTQRAPVGPPKSPSALNIAGIIIVAAGGVGVCLIVCMCAVKACKKQQQTKTPVDAAAPGATEGDGTPTDARETDAFEVGDDEAAYTGSGRSPARVPVSYEDGSAGHHGGTIAVRDLDSRAARVARNQTPRDADPDEDPAMLHPHAVEIELGPMPAQQAKPSAPKSGEADDDWV
jgi:hypothetical protein